MVLRELNAPLIGFSRFTIILNSAIGVILNYAKDFVCLTNLAIVIVYWVVIYLFAHHIHFVVVLITHVWNIVAHINFTSSFGLFDRCVFGKPANHLCLSPLTFKCS